MYRLRDIALVTIVSCFASCSQHGSGDDSSVFDSDSITEYNVLPISVIDIDNIILTDSTILIHSSQSYEKTLYLYNLKGQLLSSGIGNGQGDNDVMEISSIHLCNDICYIYDSRAGKISKVSCDSTVMTLKTMATDIRLMDDAVIISPDKMLTLPLNSDFSYTVSDNLRNPIDSLQYFPPKPDGINDDVHKLACTGMLSYSDRDSTFARILAYDGGVSFFKITGNKIVPARYFSIFNMSYGSINNMLPVPDETTLTGYSHIYVTPEYYYASFSDMNALDNPEGLSTEIHVFSHQGDPIYRYCMPYQFGAFAVSNDNRTVYLAVDTEEKTELRTAAIAP